jgi:hypothetical protein
MRPRGSKITGPIRVQEHRKRPGGAAAPGENACPILDCGRKVAAMGLCWGHYRRQLEGKPVYVTLAREGNAKRASAVRIGPRNGTHRQRRLALFEWWLREGLVTPEPNTGCLLWLGYYNPVTGYAILGAGAGTDPWGSNTAHRAALWFSGAKLERRNRKLHSRHLCNTPGCVAAAFNAPVSAHVVYGTAKENMADRTKRYERGELSRVGRESGPRKLDESQIAYAWAAHSAGVTYADLAQELGVSWSTVRKWVLSVSVQNQAAPGRAA